MDEIDITKVEFKTCAEEIMYLLFAHGVEYLFLNPGTDSAPLQEAAASLLARNIPIPKVITCSFESVALAAAHGYWQRTGRPQAVFVHVDVGTQNLGAMVHNIFRDRAGVVVIAGKAPYSEESSSPGSRSSSIHWLQDVADQPGIVRGYAKWTYELVRSSDTSRVIGRAVQIAASDISGLAYLMISRDVLMDPPDTGDVRRIHGFARPELPVMSQGTLQRIVELLASAARPVIVTGRIGRGKEGPGSIARLSEISKIPVVERVPCVNLPTSDRMSIRDEADANSLISKADVLLIVECDVPWIPAKTALSPGATVIQIDRDPIKAAMPLWSFPIDIAITSSGAAAIHQIANALEERFRGSSPELLNKNLAGDFRSDDESSKCKSSRQALNKEFGVKEAIEMLNEVLKPEDIIALEAVSNNSRVLKYLERSEAGTVCSSGGPGLGWALGACVGIKLAEPGRRVVAIVGDGAFMFGVPTSAFCLSAEAGTPFLVIVLNNHGYRASRLPVYELFPNGASAAVREVIGTRFMNPPNLAAVAEACGAYGRKVTEIGQLLPTLRRAFEVVETGSVAVVDIHVTDN